MPDGSLPAPFEGAALDVLVAPAPFQPRMERLVVEPGLSVAEILLRACQAGVLDPQDLCRTEVDVDGKRIEDRETIADIRPLPGQIVNVTVQVYGGGKGGNKALQAVLQVAIMVAAFAVAGPAGTAASGFFQAGTAAARIATIAAQVAATSAVTLAGGALISALAPSNKDTGAAQTYSLESQSNQTRLREQFPLCLGTHRWAFDLASSAYTTFSGDDTFITAIYALHYGPCTLTDLKIGETLLTAYPAGEVQMEQFLAPGPRNSALYPTNIHQDSFQNTLDRVHGDYATATTVDDATTVELDFYWAGGLYYSKSDGRTVNADTAITIQISPYGQNAWVAAPGLPAGVDKSGNAYPAGTYYVQAASKTPVRRTVSITLPAQGKWDVRLRRNTRPIDDTDNDTVTWTAIRMPRPGQPVVDQTLSILVLKVKAAQDLSGSLGVISGVVTPIVPIPGADGSWSTTAPSDNSAALTRWLLTGPAAAKPLAANEIDASCAEQYALIEANGWHGGPLITDGTQQDALNKLAPAGRMLIYWTGSALAFVPDWTKDAPRQLFAGRNAQGYRRKRTYPDELHAVWVEFENAGEDWKSDGLMVYADGYTAANATLIEKLSLGFACLPPRAYKEGRVYIARRELQVWTHEFTAGADAVVSSYGDRVRARRTSGLYGQSDARISHRRWGGALVSGVRLDAGVRMKAGESYAIDVRRPDGLVIGISVNTTPGLVRDLVFAAPLPVAQAPGKGDLIAFGKVNQVMEDLEITDIAPQADGTVQITAANYVGDGLVAAETGAIPPLTTFLTERVAAPTPRILTTNGSPSGVYVGFDVDAQRTATIRGFVARWRFTPGADAASSWSTLPVLAPTERSFTTPAVSAAQHQVGDADGEVRVDIELWTVLTTGEVSPAATANGILVIQGVLPVSNFAAVGAVRTAPDGSSYPVLHVSADPVLSGAVQALIVELQPAGADPAAWTSAGQTLAAANPIGDYSSVAGGKIYDVRARWRDSDGWLGDWVAVLAIAIPQNGLVATGTTGVGTGVGRVDAGQLIQNVADLFTAYGSTASTAANAAAAAASAAAAQAAQTAAGVSASSASGSATAAQGSASNSQASATDAGNQASAAHADRIAADAANGSAQSNASVANSAAAAASASQAAAQTSASLSASVGSASINVNPDFIAWANATGAPDGWGLESGVGTLTRVGGVNGRPYGAQLSTPANPAQEVGLQMTGLRMTRGWVVLEVQVRSLDASSWLGAGAAFFAGDGSGIFLGLGIDPDINGIVRTAPEYAQFSYKFSKLAQLGTEDYSATLRAFTAAAGLGGSLAGTPARTLIFDHVAIRPASQPEIDGHAALPLAQTNAASITTEQSVRASADAALSSRTTTLESTSGSLTARVTTAEGTLVTVQGRQAAYLTHTVSAGGSVATFTMAADDAAGSAIRLAADIISLGGSDALVVEDGLVRIQNAKINAAQIDDLTVGTTKIADNAVSGGSSVTTSGQTGSDTNNAQIIQTLALTTTGGRLAILASATVQITAVAFAAKGSIDLLIDGTLVYSVSTPGLGLKTYGGSSGFSTYACDVAVPVIWSGQPSAGGHTLQLRLTPPNPSAGYGVTQCQASNRTLIAQELKK